MTVNINVTDLTCPPKLSQTQDPGVSRCCKRLYSRRTPGSKRNRTASIALSRQFRRLVVAAAAHCLLTPQIPAQFNTPEMESAVVHQTRPSIRSAPLPGPIGPGGLSTPRLVTLPRLDPTGTRKMREEFGPSWMGPNRVLQTETAATGQLAVASAGTWHQTEHGRHVWRVSIRSAGAAALRIHFDSFEIDGLLYIYEVGANAGSPYVGPYTGLGPQEDGDFWSDLLFSESVTVEFVYRGQGGPPLELPFRIREVGHILAGAFPGSQQAEGSNAIRDPVGNPRAIVGCHLDVSCYPDWQNRDYPSVALLVTSTSGGTHSCSGTLINTRYDSDDVLLLLTAAHCIGDDEAARNTVFYWDYQTTECYGQPDLRDWKRTSGAKLVVAKGPDRYDDFSLLSLGLAQK